jgi:hypothetical protein
MTTIQSKASPGRGTVLKVGFIYILYLEKHNTFIHNTKKQAIWAFFGTIGRAATLQFQKNWKN